ncbi:MAG: hypothetical protein ACXWCT_15650, partial [Flavitalea sp.]
MEASYAQSTPSIPALDSIIKTVPVLMRRDENKARQIIDTLSLQSIENNYKHGIIQSLFFKAWLSY